MRIKLKRTDELEGAVKTLIEDVLDASNYDKRYRKKTVRRISRQVFHRMHMELDGRIIVRKLSALDQYDAKSVIEEAYHEIDEIVDTLLSSPRKPPLAEAAMSKEDVSDQDAVSK